MILQRLLGAWVRTARARRRDKRAQVDCDARDLLERFGEGAYFEARARDIDELRGVAIDANRPPRHWAAVTFEIGRLTGYRGGTDWGGYSAE